MGLCQCFLLPPSLFFLPPSPSQSMHEHTSGSMATHLRNAVAPASHLCNCMALWPNSNHVLDRDTDTDTDANTQRQSYRQKEKQEATLVLGWQKKDTGMQARIGGRLKCVERKNREKWDEQMMDQIEEHVRAHKTNILGKQWIDSESECGMLHAPWIIFTIQIISREVPLALTISLLRELPGMLPEGHGVTVTLFATSPSKL